MSEDEGLEEIFVDDEVKSDAGSDDMPEELRELADVVDEEGGGASTPERVTSTRVIEDPLSMPRRIAGQPLQRPPTKEEFLVAIGLAREEETVAPVAVPSPFAGTTAPLAQRMVGGMPVKRKRLDKASAEARQKEKEIRMEQRQIARLERQLDPNASRAIKHNEKDRTTRWANNRIYQSRRATGLITKNGRLEIGQGMITKDMAEVVDDLVGKAAYQAVDTPDSRHLQTANAAFWSFALAQEAFQRANKGWVVTSVLARDSLTWDSFENVYDQCKGMTTRFPEPSEDVLVEMRKSKIDRETGTKRSICSHSFGPHKDRLAKLDCLDKLLKAWGDAGLHPEIKNCEPPVVISLEKPASCIHGPAMERRLANHPHYGKGRSSSS